MRQGPPQVEINWTGIICLALVLFAIFLIVHMHDKITAFLATMGRIGPGHSSDDKVLGLIAFGLVAVLIVGIVKILVSRGG